MAWAANQAVPHASANEKGFVSGADEGRENWFMFDHFLTEHRASWARYMLGGSDAATLVDLLAHQIFRGIGKEVSTVATPAIGIARW
jgi:hypothetical protein